MTAEAKRQLKVFLCHASGDKPPVRELYRRLVAEGVDAWLDQEKLLPGQDWRVEIPRAVRDADVVVICLSNKSITKEGYVQKEIRFALDSADEKPDGAIFLIPARLEDCIVPERLSRWQWVDLYEENGFIKLLRSLKLRAAAVGVVIEPVSYEDTDKERKRRLDQLYTEGLAAFYTEDWDRAYRRFQAILSEQPNHRSAAEKLEEAENQRLYSNLYAQATEAYQSENWQLAITALEELLQKAVDYKVAAQLLRDARKREQLTELYAEARALHAARQWQAVVKVFEQIAIIEPNYPDVEELLGTAQKEVAELERLAQLNEQYSRALHEMDSGNWHEARSLLENVHKSQIGFLDTERLLRKVETEIQSIEEINRRRIQVHTLYKQSHDFIRSKNWRKALEKMEEIRNLDSQFVDTDGIFDKARVELDREEQEAQRQKELNGLYAEAVSLLQAKKYQEALEKWNAIQAAAPTFRDTSKVRVIAKRKLDQLSRPEAQGRRWPERIARWFYFNTEGGLSAGREILTEKLLLFSCASIALVAFLDASFVDLFRIGSDSGSLVRVLRYLILGGLYGLVLAFALSRTLENWKRKHSLAVIAGWMLGHGLIWIIWEYYFDRSLTSTVTLLYAFFTTFATVAAIRWASPAVQPVRLLLIFVGWMLMWRGSALLGDYLRNSLDIQYIWAIADPLSVLLGLLVTFGLLSRRAGDVIQTAGLGALGFAAGNFIIDNLPFLRVSIPAEISIPVALTFWGLIGGSMLEVPSRNARRILFSAGVCGAGLLLGNVISWVIVPRVIGESLMASVNPTIQGQMAILRNASWGIGLGLGLGLLIRRPSAMGVLAVLGAGIYMLTSVLYNVEFFINSNIADAVRGALIGLVLGYGYGYMRKPIPLQNESLAIKVTTA